MSKEMRMVMVALDANHYRARGVQASNLMPVSSAGVVNRYRVHVCDPTSACHGLESSTSRLDAFWVLQLLRSAIIAVCILLFAGLVHT
jgi:hypothetical protein